MFVEYLLNSNDELHLVSFCQEARSHPMWLRLRGSPRFYFHCFPTNKLGNNRVGRLIVLIANTILLWLLVRKIRPQVLISCTVTTYGLYSAFTHYRPMACMVWGSDVLLYPLQSSFVRRAVSFALNSADVVFVDCENVRRAAAALCPQPKLIKFPWAVDLEKFHESKTSSILRAQLGLTSNPIVICTRNHESVYAVETLIQAIPLIIRKVPEARFLLTGSGSTTVALRRLANRLGIRDYVQFLGWIDSSQMPSYYASCDVYVSPSLSDGTSAALLEAMASGLPVVVSAIPGNMEWVEHGKNGLLFPASDHVALAECLVNVLRDKGLARSLGTEARRAVEIGADLRKSLAIFRRTLVSLIERSSHSSSTYARWR